MIGLTVPLLAWVALLLAVVGYVLNAGHAPTRVCAIVGAAFALVGIVSGLVGG
ncbi:hypothetical protein [Demequina silvatica]|uniref:hypothetical protein n=1 Tax=Demequina silvatica TaxID=1638988 RepID=UPI000A842BBC|nr:hypothetical protein [Demequina silvatica]